MAQWNHSSTKVTFAVKVYLMPNGQRKIAKFRIKSGNLHDGSCAEEVLEGCKGTAIGDRSYGSEPLRKGLANKDLRSVVCRKKFRKISLAFIHK
jgi:hypothetical protein